MAAANIHLVFPMCAMVLLSFAVLMIAFRSRVNAVRNGQVKLGYFKTMTGGEPSEHVLKTGRNFSNLFEAPVLFYVACVLGMIVPVEGPLFLVLAWLYVTMRLVHTAIHIGPNKVMHRMSAYMVSWIVLLAMWIVILVKALSISAIA